MIDENPKLPPIVAEAVAGGDFEQAAILLLLIKYPGKNLGSLDPGQIAEVTEELMLRKNG